MDYSLLLGVHNMSLKKRSSLKNSSLLSSSFDMNVIPTSNNELDALDSQTKPLVEHHSESPPIYCDSISNRQFFVSYYDCDLQFPSVHYHVIIDCPSQDICDGHYRLSTKMDRWKTN